MTGDGRVWSLRHPAEQARHLALLLRARRMSGRAEALASKVLASWDREAFIGQFQRYWDPFPTKRAAKYLDLGFFMRDSATRCFVLGLFDDGRPKRILDLGCGPGYFLTLCRSLGNDVLGVDLDDEPLYNELISFQGIPRIVHAVTPGSPLPVMDGQFDIVSAFGVTFNFGSGPKGASWSAEEWATALDAFLAVTAPGGKIVIHFNRDPRTSQLFPPGLRRRLDERPGIDARFFGEHLVIQRTGSAATSATSERT
jgi:SAM-dependent methyltransferase